MADTFASLLAKLSRAEVDYLVVGGVAVFLNGYARSTFDLDILVESSPANVRRLLDCLATFGEGHARELTPEDFAPEEGAVRIAEDFVLDVFTLMSGHGYADFTRNARRVRYADVEIPHLAPEDLIALKASSVREKDRLDVEMLRRIMRGEIAPESVTIEKLEPPGDRED